MVKCMMKKSMSNILFRSGCHFACLILLCSCDICFFDNTGVGGNSNCSAIQNNNNQTTIHNVDLQQEISHLAEKVAYKITCCCESYSGDLDKWLSDLEWHGSYSYITSSDVSSIRWAFKFTLGRKDTVKKCVKDRLENVLKKEAMRFDVSGDIESIGNKLQEKNKLQEVKKKCMNVLMSVSDYYHLQI